MLIQVVAPLRERSAASAVARRGRRPAMAREHGPQIKDDTLYEDLLKQGNSKEKAARIANAKAAGTLKHASTHLEDRTKADLMDEAKKIGIEGRSRMDKAALAKAIRGHG
jgi:hypothetical protein